MNTDAEFKAYARTRKTKMEFKEVDADVDGFDLELSKLKQIRRGDLNRLAVERYAAAYGQGQKLPRLLFYREPSGEAVILGGMHRREGAAQAGLKTIPAFEITAGDPADILDISIITNTAHGVQLDRSELEAATRRMHGEGRTPEAIAKVTGLPLESVKSITNFLEAQAAVRTIIGPEVANLRKNDVIRLSSLRDDTAVKKVAALTKQYPGFSSREVSSLVTELNGLRTAKERAALVAEKKADLESIYTISAAPASAPSTAPAPAPRGPNHEARFSAGVSILLGIDAQGLADSILSSKSRKEMVARIGHLQTHLAECSKALSA